MIKYKIAILSAHEGALYWTTMVSTINSNRIILMENKYSISDKKYRERKLLLNNLIQKLNIYVIYPIKCLFILLFQQHHYNAFLVITSPFFLPALCACISRKPVISLQNDIYPEALIQAGFVAHDSIIEGILRYICSYGVTKASSVIYICQSHRKIAEKNLGKNIRTIILPVGAIGVAFEHDKPILSKNPLIFLYCGTLGLMHDSRTIESFLQTKILPDGCKLEFFLSGSGKYKFEKRLKNICPSLLNSKTVVLGDALENDAWLSKMKSAHVGMVFQSIGAENVVFPSKVFSILVAGQAVLAIVSPECELGKLVIENDCGWVVPPGDLEQLNIVFNESLDNEVLLRKRRNAFKIGHRDYDVGILAGKWQSVIIDSCMNS